MALSIKSSQPLLDKEPKLTCSKLSEGNINSTNDWVKDMIYRWTSNACAECKNQECMLQHILALETLQLESRSSCEVKEFIVKSLADVLRDSSSTNNVLKSEAEDFLQKVFHGCNTILSNIEMQRYFKSDLNQLILLMTSFLEFENYILKTSNSTIKELAQHSLSNVIHCYLQIYKQFSDKELFTIIFAKNILPSFCNLIKSDEIDCSKIDSELYRCVQTILFARVFHPQYKKFNNETEGVPATLFSTLKTIANEDLEANCKIYEIVLRVAIKSYESDSNVVDLIFRNIIQCIGNERKIFKKLLNCLTGVNLNIDNKIKNIPLSEFLMKFIEEILAKENLDSLDYELITGIVIVNPFIIDSNLESILKKILSAKSNVSISSYKDFFMTILNASICLRRENKLILHLIISTQDILPENINCKTSVSLPEEFLIKLMESFSNITTSQTIIILRSFIFHLKVCCDDFLLSASSNRISVMLEMIIELLIPFMKGIKILENAKSINAQEKFSCALVDLGSTLSSITDRILKIDNNRVIFKFIKVCQLWNDVCNVISHYFTFSISDELVTLFSTKKWLKLIAKVENLSEEDAENMGLEFSQSLLINLMKEEKLINSINCRSPFWVSVIQNNETLLSNLNEGQLLDLAETVVTNLTKNCLEEPEKWNKSKMNDKFVSSVLNQVIVKSEINIQSDVIKQLMDRIVKDFKWKKVISKLKKGSLMGEGAQFSTNNKTKNCKALRRYLNILSSLHLSHLHHDVRIVLFILISSVHLEFSHDNEISEKCNNILLNLLQEKDIDIFQFSNLQFLHANPLKEEILSEIFQLSLKNISVNSLIHFVNLKETNSEIISVFLNTVRKSKFNRNSEDFQTLRNSIEKWNNQAIKDEKCCRIINLMSLTFSLRDAVCDNSFSDELIENTKRTLLIVLENFDKKSKVDEEYLQFLELVIRNRSHLEITKETVNQISSIVLHSPDENILRPFLETANSSELNSFLKSLQERTTCALGEESDTLLKTCIFIWECMIKIEMNASRNNCRLFAMSNLLYDVQKISIFKNHWLCLLKLFGSIVSSKFFQISNQNINLILLSCMKCVKRAGVVACREILSLCTVIVKLRANFVKDKFSLLVLLNREIIKSLSDEDRKSSNANDQYQLQCLILDMEKFIIAIIKLEDSVSEIYPLILTDLVEWYCYHLLSKNLKNSLETVIQHLLKHCEHETIEFLNRTLPAATQKMFKELVTMYRKHYKFTGNI